ncbi:MAG: hypothetical protein FWF20_00735 [Betaproteobacteria bacterium]|nr:hypothetical protein [Betaproteobacteria bacterium]MCL2885305.1 hypothetical protein [Betaproteobacteria bacterium]
MAAPNPMQLPGIAFHLFVLAIAFSLAEIALQYYWVRSYFVMGIPLFYYSFPGCENLSINENSDVERKFSIMKISDCNYAIRQAGFWYRNAYWHGHGAVGSKGGCKLVIFVNIHILFSGAFFGSIASSTLAGVLFGVFAIWVLCWYFFIKEMLEEMAGVIQRDSCNNN